MAKYIATYPVEIEVQYELEDKIADGRLFPIYIAKAEFQGIDVTRTLAWYQVLDLQREIFKSLTDEQK
jgi:hypothetical protein